MSLPSSFSVQIGAIMEVLAKAAVAEITKLVEEEAVVIRLEMCRRDSEIQELKGSLRQMEIDLCKAQESVAVAEATRFREEKNDFEVFGLRIGDNGNYATGEHVFNTAVGDQINEKMDPQVKVKAEPVDEMDRPTLGTTANTGIRGIDTLPFKPEDHLVSSWPSRCGVFADVSVESTDPARNGTMMAWNSPAAATLTGSGGSPIEGAPPMQTLSAGNNTLESELTEYSYISLSDDSEDYPMPSSLLQMGPLQPDLRRWGLNAFGDNRKTTKAKKTVHGWKANQKLQSSQSSHRTLKPYKCQECGKSFTQKTRLKSHQSVHTGERPFSCQICGKPFSRQDNCIRHERFHSGLKPYRCETCGKCFTVQSNLKIHQEIHQRGHR